MDGAVAHREGLSADAFSLARKVPQVLDAPTVGPRPGP